MMGLFDYINMANTYEQRVVSNTKDIEDLWEVDTALVTDRTWKYETAVKSDHFREGCWIIVDYASTKEEAKEIHEKWVEKMKNHPTVLYDIYEDVEFSFT